MTITRIKVLIDKYEKKVLEKTIQQKNSGNTKIDRASHRERAKEIRVYEEVIKDLQAFLACETLAEHNPFV